MHLPSLLYTFATLTIAIAVPLAPGNSVAAPTPTQAIMASSPASPAAVPSMTPVGAYQCPPKQFKRCCMSVQQTSRMLIDSIGELVPALGGIAISSQVSFDCHPMADDVSPNTCNSQPYSPMCCNTENGGSGISACKPFEVVKEKYYKSFGYNKGQESQAEYIEDALS